MFNKLINFLSQSIFQKLLSFIFILLLLNYTTKEQYAVFNLYYNFIFTTVALLFFETNRVFQTNISLYKLKEREILSDYNSILIIIFFVITFLIIIWKFFFSDFFYENLSDLPTVYFLTFTLVLIYHKFLISYFIGKEDFFNLFVVSFIFPGLNIFSILFFIVSDYKFLKIFFYINVISIFFYLLIYKKKYILNFQSIVTVFKNFFEYIRKSTYYYFLAFKDHIFTLIIFAYFSKKDLILIADIGFLLLMCQFIQISNQSFLNIILNKGTISLREKYLIFPFIFFINILLMITFYFNVWLIEIIFSKYVILFKDYILLALGFSSISGILSLVITNLTTKKTLNIFIYTLIYIFTAYFVFFINTDMHNITKFFLYLILSNSLVISFIIFTNKSIFQYVRKSMKLTFIYFVLICYLPFFTNKIHYYVILLISFLYIKRKYFLNYYRRIKLIFK